YIRKYMHERIPMYYSSMINKEWVRSWFKKMIKKDKNIALGVIAKGIHDEPLMSAKELEKDLEHFKNKNITIFRLGGLNQEYINIIKRFAD
ncbi:MAG: hypothetical protein WC309_03705, partial [Candidatus Paceibacterota bacterium]